MKTSLLLTAALATMFAAPVLAQGAGATLRIDSGSAMVSTGGEFSTASSGAQLPTGSRVMLGEDSRSTLVYSNGCTQALNDPGVYRVATCGRPPVRSAPARPAPPRRHWWRGHHTGVTALPRPA